MNLDPTLTAAIVAAVVSVIGGFLSYISNRSVVIHEVQQAQIKDILAKRIELYPKLWHIHIYYETNWVFEGKPKTREWAEQYVSALQRRREGIPTPDLSARPKCARPQRRLAAVHAGDHALTGSGGCPSVVHVGEWAGKWVVLPLASSDLTC